VSFFILDAAIFLIAAVVEALRAWEVPAEIVTPAAALVPPVKGVAIKAKRLKGSAIKSIVISLAAAILCFQLSNSVLLNCSFK